MAIRQVAIRQVAIRPVAIRPVAIRQVVIRQVAIRQVAIRQVAIRQVAIRQLAIKTCVNLKSCYFRRCILGKGRVTEVMFFNEPSVATNTCKKGSTFMEYYWPGNGCRRSLPRLTRS
jgi:hypothetical protein